MRKLPIESSSCRVCSQGTIRRSAPSSTAALPRCAVVTKAHLRQVADILRAGPDENLDMIRDTVRHLTVTHGRRVMVDLEHYFDGHAHDREYAYRCCEAAIDGNAVVLVMCDTNGGSMGGVGVRAQGGTPRERDRARSKFLPARRPAEGADKRAQREAEHPR